MSSNAVLTDAVQHAVERRSDNSTVDPAKQSPASATATKPTPFESTVTRLTQAAAATTVQTEFIEKLVKDPTRFNQGSLEAATQASRILALGGAGSVPRDAADSQPTRWAISSLNDQPGSDSGTLYCVVNRI